MEKNRRHPNHAKFLRAALLPAAALWLGVLVFLAGPAHPAFAQDGQPQGQTENYCLGCHGKPDIQPLTLPNGDQVPVFVDPNIVAHSIHSPLGVECQACHTEIRTYPHPTVQAQSKRELELQYAQACSKCHQTQATRAQDSMHAQQASAGNLNAPTCTDCHGAHDVQPPDQPRAHISQICGQCHTQEFDQYKNSVHGAALIQEDNPDVPVCTDCHGVHNIHDPRTDQFRVETPELCAGCHSNQQLMAKYGIQANVYDLYKLSWHGVDVSVFKARWPNLWHNSAVCTDCHGIHDILRTDNPQSHVNPTNLLATCQKCHPGAGPNFTGAWTGHQEISLQKTPLAFYTEAFYGYFTPFVLWLSAIYVLLQIVRATVARVRRSLS